MLKLIAIEFLKIKRSLALLMIMICPLMVVVLNLAIMMKQKHFSTFPAESWTSFWLGIFALWCYFMQPLLIALTTSLLNGSEHRNQTWRLMLTLPINPVSFFAAKALTSWLCILLANLLLIFFGALVVSLFATFGYPSAASLSWSLLKNACVIAVTCFPVLCIQHALSWRFQSLVLPLALGVAATMGIVQVGSSAYWVYYPWSYSLMAVNGGNEGNRQLAVYLALLVGGFLAFTSLQFLGKRRVES